MQPDLTINSRISNRLSNVYSESAPLRCALIALRHRRWSTLCRPRTIVYWTTRPQRDVVNDVTAWSAMMPGRLPFVGHLFVTGSAVHYIKQPRLYIYDFCVCYVIVESWSLVTLRPSYTNTDQTWSRLTVTSLIVFRRLYLACVANQADWDLKFLRD